MVELLRDGIDCRPERPAGAVRVNLTLTEPDGTTTKINTPGAEVHPDDLERLAAAVLARAARPPGWCWPARCRRAPPRLVRRPRRRLRAHRRQVAVDTCEAPLRALVERLPDAAPDLMKPNGEELASLTGGDADEIEADPRPRRPPPASSSTGASAPCWPRSAAPAPCSSPPRAPGTPPRRPRPSSAPSVPATPACSATCSATSGACGPRAAASRRGLRQRRRRPARHHDPPPAQLRTELVEVTALAASPGGSSMTDLITTELVRLDVSLGRDKTEVIRALAAVVADAGRTTDPDQLTPTPWPARRPRRPACPAASRSRTAAPPASTTPTLAFARLDPPVDFGAKDGPADLAFLIAAPAGGDATHLKMLTKLARALVKKDFTDALRAAGRPRRSSTWSPTAGRAGAGAPSRPRPAPAPVPPPRAATSPRPAGRSRVHAAAPGGSRRSSRSPPARPASRTPTWRPRPSRPPPRAPASSSQVETQGSAGSTPLAARVDRRRRRRDLRGRRGGPRPRPLRR